MEKAEKLLALLTLVLAVTLGISSWLGGVGFPLSIYNHLYPSQLADSGSDTLQC
jgi:hypothetical protein